MQVVALDGRAVVERLLMVLTSRFQVAEDPILHPAWYKLARCTHDRGCRNLLPTSIRN